jgi:hypothetical protein
MLISPICNLKKNKQKNTHKHGVSKRHGVGGMGMANSVDRYAEADSLVRVLLRRAQRHTVGMRPCARLGAWLVHEGLAGSVR